MLDHPSLSSPDRGVEWPRRVVLLLATTSRVGGAERSALDLAHSLRERGVDVLVLCRDTGPGPLGEVARGMAVELASIRGSGRELSRLLRPADVVVAYGLRWSFLMRFLRMIRILRPAAVLVAAQRGLDVWRTPLLNAADRWTSRYVDLFLANSDAAASLLTRDVGIPEARVRTTRSGLDDRWFEAVPVPDSDGPVRIMVVGSARAEKRHDLVVEVLKRLPAAGWAGTVYTSRAGDLRVRLRDAGLLDAVAAVQGHPLQPEDYDRHDVLLHASDAESLPRAVLEALARGLAVVATDVGDTARVLSGRGLVVPAGDVEQLVTACEQAMAGVRSWPAGAGSSLLDPPTWSRRAAAEDFLAHVRGRRRPAERGRRRSDVSGRSPARLEQDG